MDTKRISRRDFIKNSSFMGASLIAASLSSSFLPLKALASAGKLKKLQETRLLMGTFLSINAYSSSKDKLDNAFGLAFEEIDRLIAIFDRHKPSTALSVLNSHGSLSAAPAELTFLLNKGQKLSYSTNYAFNPAVSPLVDLISSAKNKPSPAELKEAMELSQPGKITLEASDIHLERKGMKLTLDGIAKGYIADLASETLLKLGVKNHLVNGGGDIKVQGLAEGHKSWQIGIEDPGQKGKNTIATVSLRKGAVASSGNYEHYNGSVQRNHLMNCLGESSKLSSVTVIAPTAVEADALATALSMMKASAALKYTNSLKRAECLIITSQGQRFMSRNWQLS